MPNHNFHVKHLKDDVIQDFHDRWSIRETCDSVTLESYHPLYEGIIGYPPDVQLLHTYECKDNEVAYFKVDVNLIKLLPKVYLGIVWKTFEMSFVSRLLK